MNRNANHRILWRIGVHYLKYWIPAANHSIRTVVFLPGENVLGVKRQIAGTVDGENVGRMYRD